MNRNRTFVYAAAGALIALLLIVIGHLLDLREPRPPLERQVAYNWLTLLLAPPAFLLRLTRPDDFIVPSATFAFSALILNALWYGIARRLYLALVPGGAALSAALAAGRERSGTRPTTRARSAGGGRIERAGEEELVLVETRKR